MERLILMRHAKAVPDREAPDDHARMLTERGRTDARDAGAALAARELRADRVLVSTAARARETWALAGAMLGEPATDFRDPLYMADHETLWAEALRAEAATVMIVAHNPGLHALAAFLIQRAHDRSRLARTVSEGMPPAAWAAFSIGGHNLAAAGATLIDAWTPKSS